MKQKYKKIFICIALLLCTVVLSSTKLITNVFGKEETTGKVPNGLEEVVKPLRKGVCLDGGANVVAAEDRYKPSVFIPSHFPDWLSEHPITVKVRKGVFDVYVYELIDDRTRKETPLTHFSLPAGQQKPIYLQLRNTPVDYAIIFLLRQSDDLCDVSATAEPVLKSDGTWTTSDGTGFIYYYYLGMPSESHAPRIANVNYNGICTALRTGDYNSYSSVFNSVELNSEDFANYRTSIDFPYCNNQWVSYNYSQKDVARIIKNKILAVKIANDYADQPEVQIPADATVIEGDTNLSTDDKAIQCPAYQNSNGIQIPNKSSETKKYYKSETKEKKLKLYSSTGYNAKGDGSDGVCSQTCEETVTVTYGPPIASKAGLCFEYKVKVESNVKCHTNFTAEAPQPEDYNICTPTGGCNGGTSLRSASGPTEEFDSCVSECDGGEYSQSCINKCYQKVYGNNVTLPLNYSNTLIEKQAKTQKTYNERNINELSQEQLAYYDAIINSGPDDVGPGKKYTIDQLKIALTEAGTGYYYVSDDSIRWNKGQGRYWEMPGRYYSVNITEYAILKLQNAGRCNSAFTINNKKQCGTSLIDTGIGLLRNNAGGSNYCTAGCAWYGCATARKNNYYKNGKASNRQFLNSADAVEVYMEEFDTYKSAAADCKAKATCSTTTAEFTIKVNNKTKEDPEVDNWTTYQTYISEGGNLAGTTVKNEKTNKTSTISDEKQGMVLDRADCYNSLAVGTEGYKQTHYLTEWSFPGTWVNNKTGKISYEPKGNDSAWHLKKEKFCTNLNSTYVNTDWWTQRILHPNENVPDSLKATIDEYNIIATAKDFGYFDWDFKVSCFYALYDNPVPNGASSASNTDQPSAISYQQRSVDLKDIFPDNSEKGETTTDPNETGRTPGYNWTDGASNLKNLEYEVTPAALYSTIQARGNEIYDADKQDTYLDYEFYLSPSDLNTIRKYSKNSGNYNDYLGEIKVKNGVSYYESALFRNSGTSQYRLNANSIKTLGALGVNNQKRKGTNESETFVNTYTANLKIKREEYLKNLAGGNQ